MAMVSLRLLFFLSAILILIVQAIAQLPFLSYYCYDNGNYTNNSIYETNLNQLLSSLYSNTEIDYGFYNSSYGQNSDEVYAIGLCRGDFKPDVCRSCLKNSKENLTRLCPNQKEAIGWNDQCMLRYSNRSSIFGTVETKPYFVLWNPKSVSTNYLDKFNDALRTLLENLRSEAKAGDSFRKYAVGNAHAPDFKTLHALVHCTPDLSEQQCNDCLDVAFKRIPDCCGGKEGGRVVTPSCNVRFEVYSFLEPYTNTTTSEGTPSTNTTTSEGSPSNNSTTSKGTPIPYLNLNCYLLSLSGSRFLFFWL